MSSFQNILALDTALGGCVTALVAGEREATHRETMARGQAEHLVPFVQKLMAECALEYNALDAVVCGVGPGAFAGLRIGLSTAKAFGLSLDIPVFGVTSLQALALNYAALNDAGFTVVLETKRQDFYAQSFDGEGKPLDEARAVYVGALESSIPDGSVLIGDGVARFIEEAQGAWQVDEGYALPDMVMIAKLLQEQGVVESVFFDDPQPLYLREPDVSQPKAPPRKLQEQ